MSFFPNRKPEWRMILLFLSMTAVFFYRFLDGSAIFAFKDLSRYFYPLRHLMVEEVWAGRLPLWNPYIFCGYPLMATLQICFFYPLTAIYYLLPFNLAFNYYIIAHYFLAACFMYALLRHFQLGRPASFFGGMVFVFSGYLVSVSNMNTSLSSVIWLPLALLFFDRLIPLSLVLALMFLGGEPTVLYVTLWLLFFYALVFSSRRFNSIGILAGAALLAAGICAVQLFPFLELSQLSDRVVRTQFDVVSFRSFPLREISTFVLPFFYGNPAQFGSYTETLLGKTFQDWLISPYMGIIPLMLMFFAFWRKKAAFFLFAGLIALLFAFGKYTPLYKLAYDFIPGIAFIRYPVKFLFLTSFCFSLLASFGFEALIQDFAAYRTKIERALLFLTPLLVGLALTGLLALFFQAALFDFLVRKYPAHLPAFFFNQLSSIIQFNAQSFINLTGYIFAITALFWTAGRNLIKKPVFIGVILLVSFADLLSNSSSIAIGASNEVFSRLPENFSVLKQDKGLFRVFYTPQLAAENRLVYGENYSAALFNAKDNFAANWHLPYHFFDFLGYESVEPWKYSEYARKQFRKDKFGQNFKFLSLFNVKYLISTEKLPLPRLKLLRHKYKYGQHVYLYENQQVLPRAYFLDASGQPDLAPGKVSVLAYRPGKILLEANADKKAVLFLSEAFYPGWKFYVDGARQKVIRANGLFSAVEVPPGKHEVKYVYDPLSFKVGAGVSILSLLLTAYCFAGTILRSSAKSAGRSRTKENGAANGG